jgi:hypothetical protein
VAQGAKAYRERGGARERPDDRILIKAEVDAADEAAALARLAAAGAAGPYRCGGSRPLPSIIPAPGLPAALIFTCLSEQGSCLQTGDIFKEDLALGCRTAAGWHSTHDGDGDHDMHAALRRLVDFAVVDEAGAQQPLELLGIGGTALFLSGVPAWPRSHLICHILQ